MHSNVTRLHRADWPRDASLEAHVRQHLDGLLASPHFDASSRSRAFLCYVVDEALAGRGAALNQAAVATSVFGRQADFDPVLDPIVRVQAGRLRRSLERYYLLTGERPALRIELPKGGYTPLFVGPAPEVSRPAVAAPPPAGAAPCWPALLIHAFEIFSVLDDGLASLLTEEVSIELQRYGNVHVMRQRDLDRLDLKPRDTLQFELRGRVRQHGERWLISARVVDRLSGEQIWSDELTAGPGAWCASVDDAARIIAALVGGEHGVIVHAVASEQDAQRLPRDDAGAAVLWRHRFFLSGRPEDLAAAFESAQRLTMRECGNALAWTCLAQLHLANHAYEICSPFTHVDAAIDAAQRAVLLDPATVRVRCALAAGLLMKGDLEAARRELAQALRATGESLAYRETIGWLAALAGDWDGGVSLIRDAAARNPFCNARARQALWADYLRRGELDASHAAALEYREAGSFWRELMSACSLGHLGRIEEAKAYAAELLRIKPEFPRRGEALIARYIKAPDLNEFIFAGLRKAGLLLHA